GPWPSPAANSPSTNRFVAVPTAAGTFSPLRTALRLDNHGYSPTVLQMIAEAAARLHSTADAAFALHRAGVEISSRHVQRLATAIGRELAQQRDQKAIQHRRRELPARGAVAPQVVAVEVDGGRLRTRQAGSGPGVHEHQNQEDKIACLVTLHSVVPEADPQPEPPVSFVEPRRGPRPGQQMQGQAGEKPPAAAEAGP